MTPQVPGVLVLVSWVQSSVTTWSVLGSQYSSAPFGPLQSPLPSMEDVVPPVHASPVVALVPLVPVLAVVDVVAVVPLVDVVEVVPAVELVEVVAVVAVEPV